MRTLHNYLILYDSECPMCKVYTRAFTATGMLDADGRAPYQHMPVAACPLVDRQRAVNEIALVNTQTGEVKYGIESLFAVIANSFPVFSPLFNCRPFARIMRKVYAFISYNRKIIIPPPGKTDPAFQPAFSLKYRIAWLFFTTLVAGTILTAYSKLLLGLFPPGSGYREYMICFGQILFQGFLVSLYAPRKSWDYLGNMMTISLAGSLLLLPMLPLAPLLHANAIAASAYFLFVASLMLLEHIRRSKLLGLGWLLTITWVTYRLIVLWLIL